MEQHVGPLHHGLTLRGQLATTSRLPPHTSVSGIPSGYPAGMTDAPTEDPKDKDLQDHTFGLTAAAQQEEAEDATGGEGERSESGIDERTEPHAGGKA
jgi:hypothetical protein